MKLKSTRIFNLQKEKKKKKPKKKYVKQNAKVKKIQTIIRDDQFYVNLDL